MSAHYSAPVDEFLRADPEAVVGRLSAAGAGSVEQAQLRAWQCEIELLRQALRDIEGHLFLEFDVLRLGSRIDAVVVAGAALIPLEFKVGARGYLTSDFNQAWDYGLDLKNFHAVSHDLPIFPILCATEADASETRWEEPAAGGVRRPRRVNAAGVAAAIREAGALASGSPIDGTAWGRAPYHPTPTIVQAARALYAQHSVEAISRNDAGARNLQVTSRRVEEIIDSARADRRKVIVLVTGVPGAGKTLVGLNVATRRRDEHSETHAVFLSENGPLVAVLREALVRDEHQRLRAQGRPERKGAIAQKVKAFIQNVRHFRDDGLRNREAPPHDRVAIFDEAQRAWDLTQTAKFMKRRKGVPNFSESEPQFLVGYLDRHQGWAVVVCLVGGGQEIHTGEAGIKEWLEVLRTHYPEWQVHISPHLTEVEFDAESAVRALDRARSAARTYGGRVNPRSPGVGRVQGRARAHPPGSPGPAATSARCCSTSAGPTGSGCTKPGSRARHRSRES